MNLDEHVAALRGIDGDDSLLADETRLRLRRSLDDDRPFRVPGVAVAIAVLLVAGTSWALATGQIQELWRAPEVELPKAPYTETEPPKSAPAAKPAPSEGSDRVAVVLPAHARSIDDAEAMVATPAPPAGTSTKGDWGAGASSKPAKKPPTPKKQADNHPAKPAPKSNDKPRTDGPVHSVARNDGEVVGAAPMSATHGDPLEHAPVESLYRAAHELHFHGNDPAAALAAWDRYLEVEPTGRFAVEARYNRALCLIRLARYADARTALAPFADGEVEPSGYRQDDAKKLIDKLNGSR